MKRLWFAALLAAVASVVAVPESAPASTNATVAEMVSPVGPSGYLQPGYHVVKRLGLAACAPNSAETGNAYRCQVKFGYDPCWVMANKAYVACLSAPYDKAVTRLHVGRYQNKGGLGQPVALPWGLQLVNGVRTTFLPHFGKVGKYPIHYSYDEFKTVLVGPIDKSNPVWRIRKAKDTGQFHFKVVGWVYIQKAWIGEPTKLGSVK